LINYDLHLDRLFDKIGGGHYLLISKLEDIAWLSGFSGTMAYALVGNREAFFITDSRYELIASSLLSSCWELVIVDKYIDFFEGLSKFGKKIVISADLNLIYYKLLEKRCLDIDVDFEDTITTLRAVKDIEEIYAIKEQYKLAADSFSASLDSWRYGQKECEWAAVLEYNMRLRGARGSSFDTIIASGRRSNLPHGVATEKIIAKGEPITIDFGSKGELYTSDYTRVVYDGTTQEVFRLIEVLKSAIDAVKKVVRPGVAAKDLDKIARDVIKEAGYKDYFKHSLGHGVGAEVHEKPKICEDSNDEITEGMVFTIEPGIYIPDGIGVRLEDTVFVTKDSYEEMGVFDDYVYRLD
jgi:Xaa-Pro aminopeptidase